MTQQLALDIAVEETVTKSASEIDFAMSVLQAHDGDAVAAIRSLLEDADFLRDQLWIASNLVSKGISRGWQPKYERV